MDIFLCNEGKKRPLMEPVDAAKWFFQRVFGCSHLLCDPKKANAYLKQEMEQCSCCSGETEPENLGGGMLRLPLCSAAAIQCGCDAVFHAMAETANANTGTLHQLETELSVVEEMCDGILPFSRVSWLTFLKQWKNAGYPVVSHSERYHNAYHPHYRVIASDLFTVMQIAHQAESMIPSADAPLLIVLEGPCGSGKTTIAQKLALWLDATVIHTDDYYCLPENRRNEIAGHMDFEKLRSVLSVLLKAENARAECWQCSDNTFQTRFYPPKQVLLLEGSYGFLASSSFNAKILRVFLQVDEQEQLRRLACRAPAMLNAFQKRWIPAERLYYDTFQIPESADLVLRSISWGNTLAKK